MHKTLISLFLSLLLCMPLGAEGFLKGKILYFDEGKEIAERSGASFDFSLTGGLSTGSSLSILSVERALEKAGLKPSNELALMKPAASPMRKT